MDPKDIADRYIISKDGGEPTTARDEQLQELIERAEEARFMAPRREEKR